MRRFFVSPGAFQTKKTVIRGGDARHIAHVLRMRPGEEVELVDGAGGVCRAVIESVESDAVSVCVLERRGPSAESSLCITLAMGFLKDKKMDLLVRQLTELGVRRLLPFFCRRSVPRPDGDRLRKRKARWETIAREAVKQCRRECVPEILEVAGFEEMLAAGVEADHRIFFWEEGAEAPAPSPSAPSTATAFLALGPEGGFTEAEAEAARGAGYRIATLGPRILRAETAAVAACAVVQYLLGDMGPQRPENP